jgi:hypothetical protein
MWAGLPLWISEYLLYRKLNMVGSMVLYSSLNICRTASFQSSYVCMIDFPFLISTMRTWFLSGSILLLILRFLDFCFEKQKKTHINNVKANGGATAVGGGFVKSQTGKNHFKARSNHTQMCRHSRAVHNARQPGEARISSIIENHWISVVAGIFCRNSFFLKIPPIY